MSMIGHVRQITSAELEGFQRDPGSVQQAIHGKMIANLGNMRAAFERANRIGMKIHQEGAGMDPTNREKLRAQMLQEFASVGVSVPGEGPDETGLTLEKSWHTLHYLLTGSADQVASPLGNAILGGQEIGGDVGYGPARFLTPEQVRETANALSKISADDLARGFDLRAMNAANVYACKDPEDLELAQQYFQYLTKYYSDAAASGNAMLLYLD